MGEPANLSEEQTKLIRESSRPFVKTERKKQEDGNICVELPVIQIISIVFYSGTLHIVLQFTGVVITMFGVLAFIVSVTQMKENWTAGVQKEEKTSLVTTGIYSISRNPAFLGFDLMYKMCIRDSPCKV